jgi:hypothetical protein
VRRGLPTRRGLSIAVADGLIRTVKGKRVARIALQWEYLPLDSLLLDEFVRQQVVLTSRPRSSTGRQPASFRLARPEGLDITDTQIHPPGDPFPAIPSTPTVATPVDSTALRAAREAVFAPLRQGAPLDKAALSRWNKLFETYWQMPGNAGFEAVAAGRVVPRNYYGLLRDHDLLYHILSGNSPRMILHLPQTNDVYVQPRSASKWTLRSYTLTALNNTTRVEYDRYTLTLAPAAFDVELSEAKDTTDVPLRATAVWDTSQGINMANPALEFGNIALKISPPPAAAELPDESGAGTGNWLEAVLKMGGSTGLGEAAGNLFASENSSVFAGALISRGEVGRLVGLNYAKETDGSARPGVMAGIDVNDSDKLNLFAGPSLSLNAIQIALGARFTTEEMANGRSSFQVRPAAVLSFDLSRALGRKDKRTSLEVDSTKASYGWGKSSDAAFAAGFGLANLRAEAPPGFDPLAPDRPFLTLERVVEKDGKLQPSDPPAVFPVELDNLERMIVLPQGRYRYVVTPASASLVAVDGTDTTLIDLAGAPLEVKPNQIAARLHLRLNR